MKGKLVVVLLFLPPALLLFTLFVALPMGEAAWYSFYNWNGYGTPETFVGLKNYELLFQERAFRTALVNNLMIIAVSLLAGGLKSTFGVTPDPLPGSWKPTRLIADGCAGCGRAGS